MASKKLRHVVLLRARKTSWQGTPGRLYLRKGQSKQLKSFCRTIELPWLDNAVGKSCIEPGTYLCKYTMSPRYKKKMYILMDVDGRSGIRIHSASYAGSVEKGYKCHLLGCIALGKGFIGGPGTGSQLLLHTSRVTMKKFEKEMGGKDFYLTVEGEPTWADS